MLPHLPDEAYDEKELRASNEELLPNIHRVITYSGLNYHEVLELPCDVFMAMLRDCVIEELNSTDEGREYLQKCKRLNSTEIDVDGLHDFINR